MKRYIWVILALLLLTGYQGQPPELTETAEPTATPELTATPEPVSVLSGVEVDIGDGEHTFWVELTRAGESGELVVSVYQKEGDPQPIQRFTEWSPDYQLTELEPEDVDFDGCMDFHFVVNTGSQGNDWSAYYIWDVEQGGFVSDPYGLNDISNARFVSATQEVVSDTHIWGTPWEDQSLYYQYENGALLQVGERYARGGEYCLEGHSYHRLKVDEAHIFWVEIVQREEEKETGGIPVLVSVYDADREKQIQSFEDTIHVPFFTVPVGEDVNFDGYVDLTYSSWLGASSGGSAYYVWDKEQEAFVRDPYGLEDLAMPKFDPEKQVIETWNHSGVSYIIEFYRYLGGKLTCIRRLRNQDNYKDDFTATLTVEDYDPETGTLKEVYREENALIGGVTYASTEEFSRWHDLDYHGE